MYILFNKICKVKALSIFPTYQNHENPNPLGWGEGLVLYVSGRLFLYNRCLICGLNKPIQKEVETQTVPFSIHAHGILITTIKAVRKNDMTTKDLLEYGLTWKNPGQGGSCNLPFSKNRQENLIFKKLFPLFWEDTKKSTVK